MSELQIWPTTETGKLFLTNNVQIYYLDYYYMYYMYMDLLYKILAYSLYF